MQKKKKCYQAKKKLSNVVECDMIIDIYRMFCFLVQDPSIYVTYEY